MQELEVADTEAIEHDDEAASAGEVGVALVDEVAEIVAFALEVAEVGAVVFANDEVEAREQEVVEEVCAIDEDEVEAREQEVVEDAFAIDEEVAVQAEVVGVAFATEVLVVVDIVLGEVDVDG